MTLKFFFNSIISFFKDSNGNIIHAVDSATIKARLNANAAKSPFYLKLQDDGDLVIFNADKIALWRTFTSSDTIKSLPPYTLVLHDNGDLILYARKKAIWSWINELKI